MRHRITVEELSVGTRLATKLVDEDGVEILGAGVTVTSGHLTRLTRIERTKQLFLPGPAGLQTPTSAEPTADESTSALPSSNAAEVTAGAAAPPLEVDRSTVDPTPDDSGGASPEITPPTTAPTTASPPGIDTPVTGQLEAKRAARRTLSIDQLQVGSRLAQHLYDHDGLLLLAAGQEITQRFLDLLGQRTATVELADPEPTGVAHVEAILQEAVLSRMPVIEYQPDPRFPGPRLPLDQLTKVVTAGQQFHEQVSAELQSVYADISVSGTTSVDELRDMVHYFAKYMLMDADLLGLVVNSRAENDEYLFNHSVDIAMISMSIAGQLGLPQNVIYEIGLGALLHDVGMLQVPTEVRLAPRRLSSDEFELIRQHPVHTLEVLNRVGHVPVLSQTIAFQVHERGNGTGYPRGRSLDAIHPFARIAAIADMFSAMVRPRAYRKPHLPHDAIRELLVAGRQRVLDRRLLHAFVDRFSVFPVGSLVYLDDGQIGKVIRGNVCMHTRPVVLPVSADGRPIDTEIDLAKREDIQIIRAGPLAMKLGCPVDGTDNLTP